MKQSAWALLLVAAAFFCTLFVMGEAEAQQGADEAVTAIPQSAQQNTNREPNQSATGAATQPTSEAAPQAVVNPGDSLWSIAQERLDPGASPQQIEDEVAQIYALNRNVIGENPNLILAGQELFLPPPPPGLGPEEVRGPAEPSPAEPGSSTSTPVVPEEPVVVSEQPSVPATAPGGTAEATSQPSDESVPQTAASEQPAAQSDANQPAQTPTESSSTQPDNTERRTIGLGILALSLLLLLALVLRGVRSLLKERERRYKALHYYDTPHRGQGEQEEDSLTGAGASEPTPFSGGRVAPAAEIPPEIPTTPSGDARILRLRARRLRGLRAQRKLPKIPTTSSGDAQPWRQPWRLRELRLRTQRKRVRSGYEERFPRGRW